MELLTQKRHVHPWTAALVLLALSAGSSLFVQTATAQTATARTANAQDQKDSSQTTAAPDNTATNKRDRDKAAPTADQQKENKSDRETARQIRRSIVKDKSLSMYAHNVKVIVQDGKVTLKGPVRTEEEKTTVASKASEVAGDSNVDNQLTVATKVAKK